MKGWLLGLVLFGAALTIAAAAGINCAQCHRLYSPKDATAQEIASGTIPLAMMTKLQAQGQSPPPVRALTWDYPPGQLSTNLVFEIWHTTDLRRPFTYWKTVAAPPVAIPNQPAEFFIVRTRDLCHGICSTYAPPFASRP